MKPADEERFAALISWATTHGTSLHPALEVYKDDVTGFSMRVKEPSSSEASHQAGRGVNPQDEILSCPLKISLSYLNALTDGPILTGSARDANASSQTQHRPHAAFPPEFMTTLPPHIISRFFLMKQYLLGKSSFWYPYIATLPQPDGALTSWNLPPFWPQEDVSFLEGTNTGIALEEINTAVKAEFRQARKMLKQAGFEGYQEYTSSLHTWAFCMFASRSFRPSLVIPKTTADAHIPKGVELDDFSVLLPVFDIINHSMQAQVRWLPASSETESSSPPCCRFQTFDTYTAGQQIFNSYGTKTNSELLLSYGFIIPETEALHNDYIHLRKKTAPPSSTTQNALLPWTTNKPQDFLISLRPMNHPSSLAGSRRQLVAKSPDFLGNIRPEFAHVEDSLVWDLCLMVAVGQGGEEKKAAFMNKILSSTSSSEPTTTPNTKTPELTCLHRILSQSSPQPLAPEISQVLAHVKEILLGKIGQEYDKICETDPGAGIAVDEDGNQVEVVVEVEPQTSNQALALAYRNQAKKVLENAIAALVPDWQAAADGG